MTVKLNVYKSLSDVETLAFDTGKQSLIEFAQRIERDRFLCINGTRIIPWHAILSIRQDE